VVSRGHHGPSQRHSEAIRGNQAYRNIWLHRGEAAMSKAIST
jgi:hypothetical protein